MRPELTVVVPHCSWQVADAVVDLDWSIDGRLVAVTVDGGAPIEGRRGHGIVAGCWAGPAHHARGYHDGAIMLTAGDGRHTIYAGAGPLAAMLWAGSELVAARRQLLVVGSRSPLPGLDVAAGQLRALAALTPSYLVAVGDLAGSVHVLTVGNEADGRELTGIVAAADDELTFWTVGGGEPADQPACALGHDEPITALAVSPTSALVAAADAGGTLCLWSLRDLGGPVWRTGLAGESPPSPGTSTVPAWPSVAPSRRGPSSLGRSSDRVAGQATRHDAQTPTRSIRCSVSSKPA